MLALSGNAVPHLSLAEIERVCDARGLDGQELVVKPGEDPEQIVARVCDAHARIVAIRLAHLAERTAPAFARVSRLLAAPVSIAGDTIDAALLARIVPVFEDAGGRLLLGHRTDLDEALATLAMIDDLDTNVVALAWELQPSIASLDEGSAVLFAIGERLGLVRLHGGGPEQRDQDGRGIGPLLGELAAAGYRGPIVLSPSSRDPALLERWARWAASRGSSGCGHAVSTREVVLDMRDVEPRHRLETILGAYRTLIPGATLHLTVDHDPTCMYYTLEATEPAKSFQFQIVENGPEVWRADVTKC
jgi:uncharacterized protein (DUF2249 family)